MAARGRRAGHTTAVGILTPPGGKIIGGRPSFAAGKFDITAPARAPTVPLRTCHRHPADAKFRRLAERALNGDDAALVFGPRIRDDAAMAPEPDDLRPYARDVAEALRRSGRQLVLAESCTAGLVAASLGEIPGVSRHLCGSAVVYQAQTKTSWLGVTADLLAAHDAVSAEIAIAMTAGVLEQTSQADLAAAITGHLGPDAPTSHDGVIYIATCFRGQPPKVVKHRLEKAVGSDGLSTRRIRQRAAARLTLEAVLAALR